ncbi:tetratricopeptide repeat protein [Candidatus Omnitrophota bacterium]
MNSNNKDLIAVILICLAVFGAYINTLPNSFVFDDRHMIVDNAFIKNPAYLPAFFNGEITSEPIAKGMYRPVLMLSFAFNYLTGGLKPYGYHIINILLHFLNACFLYFLLKIFLKDLNFNFRLGLALMFCLHPVNTEAVAYISSRSDLLSSLFVISGIYAYAVFRNSHRALPYLWSILLYILALLSKETGIVALGLIVAYEFIFTPPVNTPSLSKNPPTGFTKKNLSKLKPVIFLILPFVLITLAYFILRKSLFGVMAVNPQAVLSSRSLSANILIQAVVSLFYIYAYFFPFNLCIDHNFLLINASAGPWGLVSLAIVIALIAACLFFKKRIVPLISFSCLWYFICLSPKFYARLNLVAAEHQAYLALFALYFIFAYLLLKIQNIKQAPLDSEHLTGQANQGKLAKYLYLRYLLFFILGLFFVLTITRNFQWRNEYTLWKAAYKISPQSGIASGALGLSMQNQGFSQEAEGLLHDSADFAATGNSRAASFLNLATFYALQGEPEKGLEVLKKNKDYLLKFHAGGFYKSLGFVNMLMGRKQEASQAWEQILKVSAHNAKVKALLGILYLEQFLDKQKAKQYFQEAIADDPDVILARLGLAVILEEEDTTAAITEYEEIIKRQPGNFIAYFHLGLIYAKTLLSPEAEGYFKKAIQLNPNASAAHYNLCIYYLSLSEPNYKLAQGYFSKAKALGYPVDKEIEDILTNAPN